MFHESERGKGDKGEERIRRRRPIFSFSSHFLLVSAVFLFFFFSFFFFSCSKKNNKQNGNDGRVSDGNTTINCSSDILFSPLSATGESPLTVTFTAFFEGKNGAKGITGVALDFGADNYVDIITTFSSPETFYSFTATYSSVASSKDAFIFFWNEDGRVCQRTFVSSITVNFFCPKPETELIAQVTGGKTAVLKVRVKNMSLNEVRFYGGVESISPISCIPDPNISSSCNLFFSFPSFGDWSFCWYAESYCGRKEELKCSSAIISYPFTEAFSYYFKPPTFFKYTKGKFVFSQEPYIVFMTQTEDGEMKIERKIFIGGEFIDMNADDDYVWIWRRRQGEGVIFELVRVSIATGEQKTVISDGGLFAVVALGILQKDGKRYAVLVRDLGAELGLGDILVYDVTGGETTFIVCSNPIPQGARYAKVMKNGFIFVSTSTQIYVYKINFPGDICEFEIRDPISFSPGYSIDKIFIGDEIFSESGTDYAIGVWASENDPVRGKFSVFKFYFSGRNFETRGPIDVIPNQKVKVTALSVSPENASLVAISYFVRETGENKVKFFDISKSQSIGGVDGFSLPEEGTFIFFQSSSTAFILGNQNTITKIKMNDTNEFTKKIFSLSGVSDRGNSVFLVNCAIPSINIFAPDGSGIVQLDVTNSFSANSTASLPISVYGVPGGGKIELISKGADGNIYSVFQKYEGGNLKMVLSDLTFSRFITSDITDIRTFAVGNTLVILGGPQGVFFANKNLYNSKFILYQRKQLKKVVYSAGFFFLFSGNDLDILSDEMTESLLFPPSVVSDYSVSCLDISVSNDSKRLYCLRSFGVKEFLFDGKTLVEGRERAFSIPAGNIINSSFSKGYIFFISDLIISQGFGVINTEDLRIVILTPLDKNDKVYGIDSSPYCSENIVLFSIYGSFGSAVVRGFAMGIPK